jgi:hypothetical protein
MSVSSGLQEMYKPNYIVKQAVVNTVIKLWVLQKAGNFLDYEWDSQLLKEEELINVTK